jgi:hypothetical protein
MVGNNQKQKDVERDLVGAIAMARALDYDD